MTLRRLLRDNLGIVTRRMLREQGITDHQIRRWIASGALRALSRSVVAVPTAHDDLVRAATLGGRLACISAAKLRGIWTIDDGMFHVALRSSHGHFTDDGATPRPRPHWDSRPIDAFGDLPALESGRNMLMHIAKCQPVDYAVAAFDSAVRQELITREELQVLASAHRGRFAAVVALVSDKADSGLESIVRVRLALAGVDCREQVVIDGHPVDLLIGDRLIIQLDGKQHLADPVQLARDRRQDRRLRQMGYTVLRFGYADIVHHWAETWRQITAYLTQRAHDAR